MAVDEDSCDDEDDEEEVLADIAVLDEGHLEQLGHHGFLAVSVGRVALVGRESVLGGHQGDTLGVGESQEAVLPVVSPVATCSHSSEGEGEVGHLEDGVIGDEGS